MSDELYCMTELLCCCILFDDCETNNNNNNINNSDNQFVNNNRSNDAITIVEGVPLLKNRRSNKIERD